MGWVQAELSHKLGTKVMDANFASICGPGIAQKCAKCNSLKFAFVLSVLKITVSRSKVAEAEKRRWLRRSFTCIFLESGMYIRWWIMRSSNERECCEKTQITPQTVRDSNGYLIIWPLDSWRCFLILHPHRLTHNFRNGATIDKIYHSPCVRARWRNTKFSECLAAGYEPKFRIVEIPVWKFWISL